MVRRSRVARPRPRTAPTMPSKRSVGSRHPPMRCPLSFRSASVTKQLVAYAIPCCIILLYQFRTLHDLTTSKDIEINDEPAIIHRQNAICKLANNLDVESQNYTSYKLGLDWSNVDHVTKSLCRLSSQSNEYNQHVIHNDTLVILTFKAARSGSTFFSTVLVKALQAMKTSLNKTAYLNWEPYCRVGCYQLKSPALMESELSTILSSNCTNMTENPDPPLCNTPNTHKKCCPIPKCHANHSRSAISVLSLNPRFSDSVRWDKILSPSFPRTSSARVFNLRRTNLVKLAYSKYHHDGCHAINDGNLTNDCKPEDNSKTSFSFDCLLQCIQHYGIGDQEFSSSVAYVAAKNTKVQQPHLVLYEDVMRDQLHASKHVFKYVGVKVKEGDNFFNFTKQTRLHGDDICEYDDVNCTDWKMKLEKDYPCLLKQLDSNSTVAWSVPIESTADKTKLSIQGDCHRLQNLDTTNHTDRRYEELYLHRSWYYY